jgi:cyclophilin family peptidyl-prolyl cis-trans isomerase
MPFGPEQRSSAHRQRDSDIIRVIDVRRAIEIMKIIASLLLLLLSSSVLGQADSSEAQSANPFEKEMPTVAIHTSLGRIVVELYEDQAPITAENFLTYAREGYYEGTIFHRIISNFMIQGGGFDADYSRRETRDPIQNEADNGLSNERGTLAMARTTDPHSASAQFFINVVDNPALDHRGKASGRTWGYAVFGRVIEGMEVVDEIRFVPTGPNGPHQNAPLEPIVIERVEIL